MTVTLGTEAELQTGLLRRDGGRYSTRRVIPLDLRGSYGGKAVITKALGTSDPKEARVRHAALWASQEAEFAKLRAELAAVEAGDDQAELSTLEDLSPTLLTVVFRDDLRVQRDQAAGKGELRGFMASCQNALLLVQAMLDGETEASDLLPNLEAKRNALRSFLFGDNALAISAARERLEKVRALQADVPVGESISDAVDHWVKRNTPTVRTVARTRKIVEEFVRVTQVARVAEVSRSLVQNFADALLEAGQSPANVNVKLGMLGTPMNDAVRRDVIQVNPFSRIRVIDKRLAREKRRVLTVTELNTVFSSPIYTQRSRPKAGGGEAAFWLPLLALYTGARLTELAQIYSDDVDFFPVANGEDDRVQRVALIHIRANRERSQSVKNAGSERRIPISAALMGLGFLEYVEFIRGRDCGRLFPDIEPNSVGELAGKWSKWWGRYRQSKLGIQGSDAPFHSFRHTFKEHARESEIPVDAHNAITGHQTGDVADAYGAMQFPLKPLVAAMERFRIAGLQLPPRWTPPSVGKKRPRG